MRLRTTSRSGWAALIASAALIVFAAPASAADDFTIQSVISPEPALRGNAVTHTFTLTNNTPPGCVSICDSTYDFQMLLLRTYSDKAVANPFLAVTSSYGSCTIDPVVSPYYYHSATCHLGPQQGIPPTVQIVAKIQANESMEDDAGLFQANGYKFSVLGGNPVTHVINPPAFTGSKKIQLTGLPATCAQGDLTVKAHVTAAHVAHIVAYLSGPTDEWRGHEDFSSNMIAHADGSSLKAKVRGSKLKADPSLYPQYRYYTLAFTATIKGHPSRKIKRAVTFQLC